MSIRFDEKGKFFTDVVSKETVAVIIQTLTHRIRGNIHIRPGERLKDEITRSEGFFAITDATVFDHAGKELHRGDFIAVNRDHIVWILPEDQVVIKTNSQKGGAA